MTRTGETISPPFRIPVAGFVCFVLLVLGCAHEAPLTPSEPVDLLVQEVLEVPGMDARTIYEKAREWVSSHLATDLDVVQYANRDKGIIVAKTYISHRRPRRFEDELFDFRFGMIVEVRDGRFRVTFNEMELIGKFGPDRIYKEDMTSLKPRLIQLAGTLKGAVDGRVKREEW